MNQLENITPIALGFVAFALFYISFRYRDSNILGRFEFFYGLGNLVMMMLLFSIYSGLQNNSNSFSEVVFPFFMAMAWVYVVIMIVLVFRLLRDILAAYKNKKLGDFIGF